MEKNSTRRPDEVEAVFNRALEVVHAALVSEYRLTEEEAKGAEEDLFVWFQRFAKRGGAAQIPARLLRLSLLSAACQYGRSFQLWRLGEDGSRDEELNGVLARESDEVAKDLDRRFEKDR